MPQADFHRLFKDLWRFRHVTHVNADGGRDVSVGQRSRQLRQQHYRQVIYAVEAHIFQRPQSDGFPEPERPLTIISTMYRFSSVR